MLLTSQTFDSGGSRISPRWGRQPSSRSDKIPYKVPVADPGFPRGGGANPPVGMTKYHIRYQWLIQDFPEVGAPTLQSE